MKWISANENTEVGCFHYLVGIKNQLQAVKIRLELNGQSNWITGDHVSGRNISCVNWAAHWGKVQKKQGEGASEKGTVVAQEWNNLWLNHFCSCGQSHLMEDFKSTKQMLPLSLKNKEGTKHWQKSPLKMLSRPSPAWPEKQIDNLVA